MGCGGRNTPHTPHTRTKTPWSHIHTHSSPHQSGLTSGVEKHLCGIHVPLAIAYSALGASAATTAFLGLDAFFALVAFFGLVAFFAAIRLLFMRLNLDIMLRRCFAHFHETDKIVVVFLGGKCCEVPFWNGGGTDFSLSLMCIRWRYPRGDAV